MRVDKYAAEIVVGGAALQEFKAARAGQAPPGPGVCVVAYTLFEEGVSYKVKTQQTDPFGEAYEEEWPVTPYEVRVHNASAEPVFADVVVDGAPADTVWVGPWSERTVKGFAVRDREGQKGYQKFEFSMPTRAGGGGHLQEGMADVSTIKIRFKEALNPRTIPAATYRPSATGHFAGVNKNTAHLAKSDSVSRAGETVYEGGGPSTCKTITYYNYGRQTAELVFRYGQIDSLKLKGYDIKLAAPPPPGWFAKLKSLLWRPFAAAPASKRKRDDDDSSSAPPSKKASSSSLAAPEEDEDEEEDVIDLT